MSTYERFVELYPTYEKTHALDKLRRNYYPQIKSHVYLDYTGGHLYSDYQLQKHQKLLLSGVFGNTHSTNKSSQLSTKAVETTRRAVLHFFNADPNEYDVIFTANATGALKLVGESYPFNGGRYLLTMDNHNSVNGIREFAKEKGASITYVPLIRKNMRLETNCLLKELKCPSSGNNLFAYPAQSNFSGVKHSLSWISTAQSYGWNVLLDASAFVPSNRLNLRKIKPCFVAISFYKMFGYPTGIGALIAKKSALLRLERPWFAGGTIELVTTKDHIFGRDHVAFEDGTINYLNIPAIEIGLQLINRIGYPLINERIYCLTDWLLSELLNIKYNNGTRLIEIYGPKNMKDRGGTIGMNFYRYDGTMIPYLDVQNRANKCNISIRSSCMCNPGSVQTIFGNNISEPPPGIVRVSIGFVTNFHDVNAFVKFARGFLK